MHPQFAWHFVVARLLTGHKTRRESAPLHAATFDLGLRSWTPRFARAVRTGRNKRACFWVNKFHDSTNSIVCLTLCDPDAFQNFISLTGNSHLGIHPNILEWRHSLVLSLLTWHLSSAQGTSETWSSRTCPARDSVFLFFSQSSSPRLCLILPQAAHVVFFVRGSSRGSQ